MSIMLDEIDWNITKGESLTVFMESKNDVEMDVVRELMKLDLSIFPIVNEAVYPANVRVLELGILFGSGYSDYDNEDFLSCVKELGIPLDKEIAELSLAEQRLVSLAILKSVTVDAMVVIDDGDDIFNKAKEGELSRVIVTKNPKSVDYTDRLIWIKNNRQLHMTTLAELLDDKQMLSLTPKQAEYIKRELPEYYVNSIESINHTDLILAGYDKELPINVPSRKIRFDEYLNFFS
ncbi:MAG: hypothetical protein K5656_03035 [Lachnospiraceae bacterium]|nr:hypothetical protein [Lachnospiraceae bacterium]